MFLQFGSILIGIDSFGQLWQLFVENNYFRN